MKIYVDVIDFFSYYNYFKIASGVLINHILAEYIDAIIW
jgi:hypothetical protein